MGKSILSQVIWIYFLSINILSFLLFTVDKMRAKSSSWRISEGLLLGMGAIGGALGEIMAMVIVKHKLSKFAFEILIPVFIIVHLVLLYIFTVG